MRAFIALLVIALSATGCVVRTVTLAPLQNLAVRGFAAHADREWPGTAAQQAQTADTLDWLASAIQSLATNRRLAVPDLASRMRTLRATIEEFQRGSSEAPGQAHVLHRAFTVAASLVDDLLETADLDRAPELKRAVDDFDRTVLPRRQPEAIERYFKEASAALQRVDRAL
jgi:hypothetical protein